MLSRRKTHHECLNAQDGQRLKSRSRFLVRYEQGRIHDNLKERNGRHVLYPLSHVDLYLSRVYDHDQGLEIEWPHEKSPSEMLANLPYDFHQYYY